MDCPHCDAPVEDGARFCPSCGRSVEADVTTTLDRDQLTVTEAVDGDATGLLQPVDATAVVATPPSGELRSCPACGADNSTARELCARCGADLQTGIRPTAAPVVHHPGPAEDVTGEVTAPKRGARSALVVGLVIVVGALVGAAIGFVLAARSDTPEPARPVFDAGVYSDEPEPLQVTGVGASSTRPPAGPVEYGADNLVDGDITTAWSHDPAVEAAADVDLALQLSDPAWVTALTFANGAQADDLAFTADGRVLRLRLLVAGDAVAELQLLDQQGLQRVELPEPVLVDTIRLVVLEAVAGDTYDEVSISEIAVTGHPARGDDLARMLTDDTAATEG